MEQLCGLFGLTRQAWYAATRRQEKKCFQEDLVLSEVRRLRNQIPGLGTAKLHEMMHGFLEGHRIKLGRDKLHNLLKDNGLLVKRKGARIRTTDSDHCYRKYPNRVQNLIPKGPNEMWVSDLTYFPLGSHFVYLTVVMDAYSRKIVGWSLQKTLEAKGSLQALDMALVQRGKCRKSLVHHSDRGVQYCSWMYVNRLRDAQIGISMTESGDPNENAMAERVFRTRKEDFQLGGFTNFERAMVAITQAIQAYNSLRPHASLDYLTPDQAHKRRGGFELKWYPYKKVRYGNVQYTTENQPPPQPVNSFQ
jgi:putative transposase